MKENEENYINESEAETDASVLKAVDEKAAVAVEIPVAAHPVDEAAAARAPRTKDEKKKLAARILNIVGYVLAIVIVVFTLYVSIITITRTTKESSVSKDPIFGVSFFPVQSNSMTPTFDEGDLVIAREYDGQELKVGDIVTFIAVQNGETYYNTHRIVALVDDYRVITMGDAYNSSYNTENVGNLVNDYKTETTAYSNIVAVYKSDVKGLGKFIDWMKDSTNYFVLIVVPLIVLFVLYIVYFVRMLIQSKSAKAAEQAVAGVTASADTLSDEEKARIAKEYLESLKAAAAAEEKKDGNDAE